MRIRLLWGALFVLSLVACGSSSTSTPQDGGKSDAHPSFDSGADTTQPPADSGGPDTTVDSTSGNDSGALDTGTAEDTAATDSGVPDGEAQDTSLADGEPLDSPTVTDSAVEDTGVDSNVADSGVAETGATEGGMQDAGNDGPSAESSATFTVGGTLSGLAPNEMLVLQNNGGSNLTLTANGAFTFVAPVASGAAYAVAVLTQPSTPAQACVVTMGQGTVGSANVTSVQVTCTAASYTVGGMLTGLAAGDMVTLQDNGGDSLPLSANGTFTFATSLPSGTAFAVTVHTQPTSPVQNCVVSAGTGTIGTSNVTSVVVNCSSATYTIGGVISGLVPGDSVLVEDNGGDQQFLTSNGSFAFMMPVASGATYTVTVAANPSTPVEEVCTVTNGAGTVGSANVTTVTIACLPLTSCLQVLQAKPSSTDGVYAISIAGSSYSVYCDMADGGWTQVYDQDVTVAPGYQTIPAWLSGVNTSQPNGGQYSILNQIPNLKSGTNYQFMITWPVTPQAGSVQWTQVENPLTSSQTPTISGVVESPTGQSGCGTFRGLATSIAGQPAALHGDSNFNGCYWWAIGESHVYGNGIPSYFLPGNVNGTTHAQLWEK